jgi:hypothetical protein
MLHLLYILAFTTIAFLTIGNLIRSLISIGMDSQKRRPGPAGRDRHGYPTASHPELLDDAGRPFDEPLLVIRSVTVEDARQQLDALYNASPGQPREREEDR